MVPKASCAKENASLRAILGPRMFVLGPVLGPMYLYASIVWSGTRR
jgi:hypothetical protein